jgi:hypothetical protein
MRRIRLVLTCLSFLFVVLTLTPQQAFAGRHRGTTVAPVYYYQSQLTCPPQPCPTPQPCPPRCVVYRWECSSKTYQVDSVFDRGTLLEMENAAKWRMWELFKLNVFSYVRCYSNKYEVYSYNFIHCNWKLENVFDSPVAAQLCVDALMQGGKLARYSCCPVENYLTLPNRDHEHSGVADPLPDRVGKESGSQPPS